MKKINFFLLIGLLLILQTGISSAQTFETYLNAGVSTVQAGLDVEHKLDQGYMRTGISGIYTNRDTGDFKTLEVHLLVGNEIINSGFKGELGIKGLIGTVDKARASHDVGGLAFMIGGTYQLPKELFPVQTKLFANISWTPSPMAFMHMDRNFDSKVGVDVFLVENAALECTYQYYNMKLTDIPNDGSHKDNIVTVGIKLKF
jgi:hypothetical protein